MLFIFYLFFFSSVLCDICVFAAYMANKDIYNSRRSCGALSLNGVTVERDGTARLSLRLFSLFDPVTLTFDLIFIDVWGIVMDYLCVKFGDFGFSRFGFIVRTNRITDRVTHRDRWSLYSRDCALFTAVMGSSLMAGSRSGIAIGQWSWSRQQH